MTTFAAVATSLEARAPDATKHVNYSLGMVLGVDDFNQEFAYLAGRDRWLARDIIGYGTICGLALAVDTVASKGPRLTVTTGSALTPCGQLICVKPSQCAYLNDWLAANQTQVAQLLGAATSGTLALYLTLCYRDCPADLVPIPGAPCRSEDELMAPSRLVDDFSLDLRTTPPDQGEEDLLRQFATWLHGVSFGLGPAISPEAFETLMRAEIKVVKPSPPTSPAGGGLTLTFGAPLASLNLDAALTGKYYSAAFRVWIELLRPNVHAVCPCGGGCCGGSTDDVPKTDECLLLARVAVPVIRSSNNWVVDDLGTIEVDETQRPMLLHLRMLQELIAPASESGSGGGGGGRDAAIAPRIVAAGLVGIDASAAPTFGNLAVAFQAQNTIRLTFTGYAQDNRYIVKAMSHVRIDNPTISYQEAAADGILLRVTRGAGNVADTTLRETQFMIEITQVE
jgi:hypothetical protein